MFGELKLPEPLVRSAYQQLEGTGIIHGDTAVLLIEAGAHPNDLTRIVWDQMSMLEAA